MGAVAAWVADAAAAVGANPRGGDKSGAFASDGSWLLPERGVVLSPFPRGFSSCAPPTEEATSGWPQPAHPSSGGAAAAAGATSGRPLPAQGSSSSSTAAATGATSGQPQPAHSSSGGGAAAAAGANSGWPPQAQRSSSIGTAVAVETASARPQPSRSSSGSGTVLPPVQGSSQSQRPWPPPRGDDFTPSRETPPAVESLRDLPERPSLHATKGEVGEDQNGEARSSTLAATSGALFANARSSASVTNSRRRPSRSARARMSPARPAPAAVGASCSGFASGTFKVPAVNGSIGASASGTMPAVEGVGSSASSDSGGGAETPPPSPAIEPPTSTPAAPSAAPGGTSPDAASPSSR
mmetsp:Transcript_9200/g.25719  ORF Transcript_9200/g.25719 Transcript_9200/m.25719 type:complete len:354 (-) Transcript_9200:1881-2942(-)